MSNAARGPHVALGVFFLWPATRWNKKLICEDLLCPASVATLSSTVVDYVHNSNNVVV